MLYILLGKIIYNRFEYKIIHLISFVIPPSLNPASAMMSGFHLPDIKIGIYRDMRTGKR